MIVRTRRIIIANRRTGRADMCDVDAACAMKSVEIYDRFIAGLLRNLSANKKRTARVGQHVTCIWSIRAGNSRVCTLCNTSAYNICRTAAAAYTTVALFDQIRTTRRSFIVFFFLGFLLPLNPLVRLICPTNYRALTASLKQWHDIRILPCRPGPPAVRRYI